MFTPSSTLADYVHQKNHTLNQFFTPNELIATLEQIAMLNYMYSPGNSDIIVLDDDLSHCFGSEIIHKKDLYSLCLPYVTRVHSSKALSLKNATIANEFYVDPCTELVTQDPSSLFWMHPLFTPFIKGNRRPIYSWNELCALFLDFALNTPTQITKINETMFSINPDSDLTHHFKFTYFHQSQIPDILKEICRFLGKPSNLLTLCRDLKFSNLSPEDPVIHFIEDNIQNNKMIPFIASSIYI